MLGRKAILMKLCLCYFSSVVFGVPPLMITDCSKEQQVSSKLRRKCQEAQCRLKGLEPYTPQSNAAERKLSESLRKERGGC
jgi:hypothetical protein